MSASAVNAKPASEPRAHPLEVREDEAEVVVCMRPTELDLAHSTMELRDAVLVVHIPKRAEQGAIPEEETLHFG